MFHIGLAVRRKIRHLPVAEVQIPLPDFVKPGAITAAKVAQQPVVVGPFRNGRSGDRFLPRSIPCDPKPAINRRLCGWQSLSIENVVYAESQLSSLAKNKIQMAGLRMPVLDQFFML